jgi:hypothetical protein
MHQAFVLYQSIIKAHPDTLEAGCSRSQVQNVVNAVVPKQKVMKALDALAKVAFTHLEKGVPPEAETVYNTPLVRELTNRRFTMKEIVEAIARSIVAEPDLISVTEVDGIHTLILELRVAKADMGKIIGKQGRTADALRTIISAVSFKTKKRTVLAIMD